jgi:alkenylglycerophosphocholine/alkenylglycerophosphoethanolamine hydrolase
MTYFPLVVAVILAVMNWIASDINLKTLEYVTKPGTMLALIWWIWSSVGLGGPMLWFTLGAIFCLAGDVFLMVQRDMFIFGLVAFLVGHICYVVGLNNQAPYFNLWGLIVILVLGIYIWWLYPRLVAGLMKKDLARLKIPVLVYATAISLMVYSALMTWTRPGWSVFAALSVSLGAVLFYSSDSILAWNRFVTPISHGRFKTMMTYHLGQFGIILGAILFIKLQ